ncbi:MAG TPA: DUF5698 domain-containing protein [bacterium]|nr:DUF5698 domain-containing protein [bacterium]
MTLFFIGILEMFIATAWTKVVTKSQIFSSGLITFINIIIWYYVLEKIVSDINNWKIVILYSLGCALGTILTTYYFKHKENKQNAIET